MRAIKTVVALIVASSLAVPAVSAADHAAVASSACSIRGVERKLGPTYVTSLTATKVSCASAKRLVKAYHRCRYAHGGRKGRCTTSVLGFRCTERRAGIKTQFSGKVTCRKGSARVIHTYTQFT